MNVVTLTAFLAPCLPFLLEKVSTPALEEIASKLGEGTWEKAKEIWAKLRPEVDSEPAAKVATEKLANKPDSEAWREALQDELEAIFQKEPTLADVIAKILASEDSTATHSIQIQQTVSDNQGQVIGQMQNSEAKNIGSVGNIQGDFKN